MNENRTFLLKAEDLKGYEALGGLAGIRRAVTMAPEAIISAVTESGLMGRGGAGFPTGLKWSLLSRVEDSPKYIVCNADEGEAGAFKDRAVLESAPWQLVEGIIIAGHTFDAEEAYIYLRGEYAALRPRLEQAIADVLSVIPAPLKISVVSGGGAYVCGEETALLNALEGKRGEPRIRPPFPAVKGLYGKPTLINNVETFAALPHILSGAGAGVKLVSLSGHLKNRGVYEAPLGRVTLMELLNGEHFGGGSSTGKPLQFAQLGGMSGPILFPEQLYLPFDYEVLKKAGLGIGSGALAAYDEDVCLVDYCRSVISFFAEESCGKCTPCRGGVTQVLEILTRMTRGKGAAGDTRRLEDLAANITALSACGMGQSACKALSCCLKARRDLFVSHESGVCGHCQN